MISRVIIFLIFILIYFSCKTTKINQTINKKREGLWIETFEADTISYVTKGKYKNGDEVKIWRFFENKRLVRKNKFKKNYCLKTYYHNNGKIESQGKTKTDFSDKQIHWYYDGIWKYFDKNGQLTETRLYEKGKLIKIQKTTKK